jgi:hypothetical protein
MNTIYTTSWVGALALCVTLHTTAAASTNEIVDWKQANQRVLEAGGWKAYADEIHSITKTTPKAGQPDRQRTLTVEAAIDRALSIEPGLRQSLASVSRNTKDYPLLSDDQRAVITRESRLVAEIQGLFFSAVVAQERVAYQLQVSEVASIASELATRMRKVGNLNLLHQAEEQLSFAETQKGLVHAQVAASAAREALIRRLQLGPDLLGLQLPNRLPQLPAEPRQMNAIDTVLLTTPTNNPPLLHRQSEVRQAITERNQAHALAKHYRDLILPLQRQISEEHLLHYNGMIIGVFELLKDARHQVHAVEGYLTALHAYWQAETALTPKLAVLREQLSQLRRDAWQ